MITLGDVPGGMTIGNGISIAVPLLAYAVMLVKFGADKSKRIDTLEIRMETELARMDTAIKTGLDSMKYAQEAALARMNQSLEYSLKLLETNHIHAVGEVSGRVDGIARIIDDYKSGQRGLDKRLDRMHADEISFRHRLDMKLAKALEKYDADPESKCDDKASDGLE